MPIKEINIHQWADHHECRSHLPILVRRLIRETTPGLTSLRFSGNEAVDLAGLDGFVETTSATVMVPHGQSVWEMGCNQNRKAKADADYTKRTAETPPAERATCSFVFVTPRRWQEKEDWLKERRQEQKWAGVYAYDAIDLETWLEEAPVTSRWLGELFGLANPSLLTPGEWWHRWATVTDPPLPRQLITARRHNVQQSLLEQLQRNTPVVTVLADDRQEAVAFVVASLLEAGAEDLLDRTLVATSGKARIEAGTFRKIVIANVAEGDDPDFGNRHNVTIVRAYPKGRQEVDATLQLSHVPTEAFRTQLEAMGLSREDAASTALQTGHSVPVLRRRLSRDPEIRQPPWARSRASAQQLLPFALAGAWVEKSSFGDGACLELLGQWNSGNAERFRDDLLKLDDAPITKYGNVTKVVSQLDALFAVGPFIERADLDRFFQLTEELFGERDPALDLPQDKWWMAHVLDKAPSCSGGLLSGLGDALCILSVHGAKICGERLGVDCAHRAGQVVRALMHNACEERWLSIRGHLRSLAEAAPTVFLACLEEELQNPEPPIRAIMSTIGEAGTGECLRVNLLWALEMLAWHTEYFTRVAQIIFELRRIEVKDNHSNSPQSTAQALFCAWLPATSLNVNQKALVLRNLSQRYRNAVIDVCVSLLPLHINCFGTQTAMPEWRTLETELSHPTDDDVDNAALEASHLLLDLAPFDKAELKIVIEAATRLHPDDLCRLVSEVQRWAIEANDEDKAELQQYARRGEITNVYRKNDDAAQGIAFQQMAKMLEPTCLFARHRWLFESAGITWRTLVEEEVKEQISFEDRETRIQQRRKEAITEIESVLGKDQVLQFAFYVKHPEYVMDIIIPSDAPQSVFIEWIIRILSTPFTAATDVVLERLLWSNGEKDVSSIVAYLQQNGILEDSDKKHRIIKNLPSNSVGWCVAEAMGGEFSTAYWKNMRLHVWENTPLEDVVYAIEKLMGMSRTRSAFAAIYYRPDRIPPELWIRILQGIAQGQEPNGPLPDAYKIDKILEHMEKTGRLSDHQIAQLELLFMAWLCPHGCRTGERTLAIHRELAKNPLSFVQLLSWLYKRRDGASEPEHENLSEQHQENLAHAAFAVLESWNIIPGCRDDGEVDHEFLGEWFEVALHNAAEASRREIAEIYLGKMLGRFVRHRSWDDWLPECVLDFLDRPEHNGLREEFEVGIRNARGTTCRSLFDGGAQERHLASCYRERAAKYSTTYPRVSAQLISLAKDYEQDARRQDDGAAVSERWRG